MLVAREQAFNDFQVVRTIHARRPVIALHYRDPKSHFKGPQLLKSLGPLPLTGLGLSETAKRLCRVEINPRVT